MRPPWSRLPVAIRDWLDRDRPYLGFSAGSAIAADRAIVGGWLGDGRPICPEDSAEDLDDITVVAGLGLVPFAVDVHCAPWGTLPRAIWAVTHGLVTSAVCLDENTAIVATDTYIEVIGGGYAYLVRPRANSVDDSGAMSVSVTPLIAGDWFDEELGRQLSADGPMVGSVARPASSTALTQPKDGRGTGRSRIAAEPSYGNCGVRIRRQRPCRSKPLQSSSTCPIERPGPTV